MNPQLPQRELLVRLTPECLRKVRVRVWSPGNPYSHPKVGPLYDKSTTRDVDDLKKGLPPEREHQWQRGREIRSSPGRRMMFVNWMAKPFRGDRPSPGFGVGGVDAWVL